MTPFVEVPPDPKWPAIVRATIASQPDDYFRIYFEGRLPSAGEKLALIEDAVHLLTPLRVFQNNIYRVEIADSAHMGPTFIHLAISRLDGGTCNEWADLQRIKNEIAGPEYEAMELFPAESRLVNTGNEYHLWVLSNPNYRFPVGWSKRVVFSEAIKLREALPGRPGRFDNTAPQKAIPVGTFALSPMGRNS